MQTLLEEMPRFAAMAGLLGASAFFSGAETAFFSLTRTRIAELRAERSILGRMAGRLIASPRRLLVSILLGNLLVSIGFFSASLELGLRTGSRAGAAAVGVGSLLLYILLGEFLPKGAALHRPGRFARLASLPLFGLEILTAPIRPPLDLVVRWTTRLFAGRHTREPYVSAEELKAFVRLSGAAGRLHHGEREMLEDVIGLGEIRVRELMVPRVDLAAVELGAGREALLALARERRVSKVVVHDGSPDGVVGYVAVKEALYHPDRTLEQLLRPLRAVPETKRAEALLAEMRRGREAMVLVVDEYGGTEGIVTPEDLIEELVGEIGDEYDEEEPLLHRVAPGVFLLSGDLSVRDFEEEAGIEVPEGRYDTMGGFVLSALDRMPKPGDRVALPGMSLSVLRVRGGRVRALLAREERR